MKIPLLIAYIVCGLGLLAMTFCCVMLYRNKLVYQWRTQANQSWASKANLIAEILKQNSYMWAHFPEDFNWVLAQNRLFLEIYNTVPQYMQMMNNFRMWNYQQATGTYEDQMERHFQLIFERIHFVEDKFERLKQGQP